jgi:hypothetical protein
LRFRRPWADPPIRVPHRRSRLGRRPRRAPGRQARWLAAVLVDACGKTFSYLCDFGDGWSHTVKLEKIAPAIDVSAGAARPGQSGRDQQHSRTLRFLRGPKCNSRLAFRRDDCLITSPKRAFGASNCRDRGRAMLNVGP